MDEPYFYRGTSVSVTQSKFVSGGKTYPINNITSAVVNVVKPNRVFAIVVILVGAALYFFGVHIVVIAICIIAGMGLLFLPKKKRYAAQITVGGKVTDSLTSSDRAYVQIVVDAINAAIAQSR